MLGCVFDVLRILLLIVVVCFCFVVGIVLSVVLNMRSCVVAAVAGVVDGGVFVFSHLCFCC